MMEASEVSRAERFRRALTDLVTMSVDELLDVDVGRRRRPRRRMYPPPRSSLPFPSTSAASVAVPRLRKAG
jgi:hypothetical protein